MTIISEKFMEICSSKLEPELYKVILKRAKHLVQKAENKLIQDNIEEEILAELSQTLNESPQVLPNVSEKIVEKVDRNSPKLTVDALKEPGFSVMRVEKTVPHITERLAERFQLNVRQEDLSELGKLIEDKSPFVTVLKQRMDVILEAEVRWREKHFVVVYNKTNKRFITAHLKVQSKNMKVRIGKKKDKQPNLKRDVNLYDE